MPLTKTRQRKQTEASRAIAQREADAGALAEASLQDSHRMTAQRRQLQAAFGPAAQLKEEAEAGPFAQQIEAGADPQSIGLEAAQPQAEVADAGQVHQLARWKDWGAKKIKGSTIFFFSDEGKARLALAGEMGDSAEHLEEGDWKLGLKYAMDREEGADNALKILHALAEENLRKARIAERRQETVNTQLVAEIDKLGLGDIATRALKLGVTLYIEGNLNGGIGDSWSEEDVDEAIDELDYSNFELVEIPNKKKDDTRKGIVIRDAHHASNKAQQGKGSIYRGVDVQANVNMKVLGKLVQVHLNVG